MEVNDYDSDITFGFWLKDRRTAAGLTIEEASKKSEIPLQRLKSLEIGYAEKGITYAESQKICAVYHVPLEELIKRATQNP